jgi:trehalose/maltose transport system substrate-binding protein
MSKKIFRLVVAMALMAISLAGPALAQDEPVATGENIVCPEGEAEITLAGGSVGSEREFAQRAADVFTSVCPNVTIDILEMPDSATERLNLYLQFFEAESGDVDVMQVDVIWPAIIAPHVVDMREYLTDEEVDEYFVDMINGQTVDGRLVAIPWFTDAAGLYYRTDLLEKYELEVPTTWEELEAAAATIQEGEVAEGMDGFAGYVWQGNDYEGLTCDAHEWLVSTTGDTFITADGEVNVTDENFAALVERAAGWVGTISPEGVTTYQEEESRNVWQAGNAAFMRNWPYAYNLGNADDSPVSGLFGWVPLPTGGVRSAACLGGWQLAVSKYSENVDASAAFAKYITSPEQQLQRAYFQGQFPTIPAVYEDESLASDPLFAAAGPIIGTAFARPSVATGSQYQAASAIFAGGIHDILTGQVDVETGLEDLEIDLEDFLADMEMD